MGQSRGKRSAAFFFFFFFNLTKTNKFFSKQTFDLCRRCESCRRCRRYGTDRCSVQILKQCRRSCWRGTGVTFTKHHPVRRRCESCRRRLRKRTFCCSDTEAVQEKVCLGVRGTEARVQGVHSTGVSGTKSPPVSSVTPSSNRRQNSAIWSPPLCSGGPLSR